MKAHAFRALLADLLYGALRVLVRVVYRVRTLGGANVPASGPALLVANHVSWADAFLLAGSQRRRIRFVMARQFYELPWAKPLLRLFGTIPISPTDPPKKIALALQEARSALREGSLVCIFAEGHVSRTGLLGGFRSGLEKIARPSGAPVIPVYLGGVWGSALSYAHGPLLSRPGWPPRRAVTVLFGERMGPHASASAVRQAVQELSCEWFAQRKLLRRPLGEAFVRHARRHWSRAALADTGGGSLSYGRALAGALALGARLDELASGEQRIGVLLPPSVGAALTNVALTLRRKVTVNLNFTGSAESLASSLEQSELATVVSSKAFLERFPGLPLPRRVLLLEDVLASIGRTARFRAALAARLVPVRVLLDHRHFEPDEPATILFSSGSTGTPKGVVLSHHNLLSSMEALQMLFRFTPEDRVCGALPFFHSFGFTCTLWLPLLSGFSAVYHANPLEAGKIAQAVRDAHATILPAAPTFLHAYLRRAQPADFRTLRLVLVGAERLDPALAEAFEERFGVRPLEGYGATELAPVATASVPAVDFDGVRDPGWHRGSVGRAIPGVALRLVDPETGAPVPDGCPGLLWIKGPNVMRGYLGRPEDSAAVLRDGWYATGDMAQIDQDGFVTITGRLSRFSKLGGEMVPHGAVEDVLRTAAPESAPTVAVTSVPDGKRGERLVVLYTPEAGSAERLRSLVDASGLPNLWRPGKDDYVPVEALPFLGSGKLDLRSLRELALARTPLAA